MNYTIYNKLAKLSLNNDNIINELDSLNKIVDDSIWGLTEAQTIYKYSLESLLKLGSYKNRKKYINKLLKKYSPKINLLFICHEFQTFPSFMSIYDKVINDKMFNVELIYIPFEHVDKTNDNFSELECYKTNGYKKIKYYKELDLCDYSPDVVFYLKAYDSFDKLYYIEEVIKIVEKAIFIPYGMEIGAGIESMRYQFQLPLHDLAWMCVSYSKFHYNNACKYSKSKGNNYYNIGHPRMDLINYDYSNDNYYKKIKELASNRKIIMYNPHFTLDGNDTWGTFDVFGMDILEYCSKHDELFLIYRPHPFLLGALKEKYKVDSKFWEKYNHYLNDFNNIFYDTSGNYLIVMQLSDILISDANSFVPEYLIRNKPVFYTKKQNTTGFGKSEIIKMVYECNDSNELFSKLEKVLTNGDQNKNNRQKIINKFFYFDKNISVSDKIIDTIKKYFREA